MVAQAFDIVWKQRQGHDDSSYGERLQDDLHSSGNVWKQYLAYYSCYQYGAYMGGEEILDEADKHTGIEKCELAENLPAQYIVDFIASGGVKVSEQLSVCNGDRYYCQSYPMP